MFIRPADLAAATTVAQARALVTAAEVAYVNSRQYREGVNCLVLKDGLLYFFRNKQAAAHFIFQRPGVVAANMPTRNLVPMQDLREFSNVRFFQGNGRWVLADIVLPGGGVVNEITATAKSGIPNAPRIRYTVWYVDNTARDTMGFVVNATGDAVEVPDFPGAMLAPATEGAAIAVHLPALPPPPAPAPAADDADAE